MLKINSLTIPIFKSNLHLAFFLLGSILLTACHHSPAVETTVSSSSYQTLAPTNHKHDFAAHWVTPKLLLLPNYNPAHRYSLFKIENNKITTTPLTTSDFPEKLKTKFPHLNQFHAFSVNLTNKQIKAWLKNQLIVVEQAKIKNQINTTAEKTQTFNIVKTSNVQTAAVIDALYTQANDDADEVNDLGATITKHGVTFKLWAPTAKQVKVLLFTAHNNNDNAIKTPAQPAFINMREDTKTGVWQATLTNYEHGSSLPSLAPLNTVHPEHKFDGAYYQYQVTLYHPASQKIETLTTTDPYSLSLSVNSEYSQVVDLNNTNTQPQGWQTQVIPTIKNAEDNILYEVYIRDFSASDPTLSNLKHRGKYGAFNEPNSAGIKHLKALKKAGLTTIHLLPTFDFGSVNEDPSKAIDLHDSLAKVCHLAPKASVCASHFNPQQSLISLLNGYQKNDRSQQKVQRLISELRAFDNYNWGYDPYHYTVPEGSYAQNPEGMARIIEFRQMVQSLHNLGFRVVMDVVYNHTHQAGLAQHSVIDKIVPNYYQRLNPITGEIEHSTCCDNTATEHVMMAKLMTDSLVTWARDYAIDGFRFDLMGHQPKAVMLQARAAVRKVDADTYFYGEGWNFGEVANNKRFIQASQLELGGSEIGTYSDRLRDAIRGSGFNKSGDEIRKAQGLGNGLATAPNEFADSHAFNNKHDNYNLLADQTRIGLAGNLANFPLINSDNQQVLGKDIPYGDQPTGYAHDPADTINYVSKHDNQTLWDNNQYRNAFNLTSDQRVRMHLQSLAFTLYAQGIPFVQMGTELLRSKSFLRDSYDYGDWFNRIDFTLQSNNYAVGLPPAEKDQANWPLIKQVLANNQGRDHVSPQQIKFSSDVFNDMLKIRTSSPLFRLTTAQNIIAQVSFLNTGTHLIQGQQQGQKQGLIVMKLDDKLSQDKHYKSLIVIFNTTTETQTFTYKNSLKYQLHPVQKNGVDNVVKQSKADQSEFSVPALTTAVFVMPRS